uniref:Putative 5.3 kDa protein n=1 Tax=Ixodes ricinus TaxID=34613 RepID=A0A0K8RF74_IXORI
MRATTLFLVAVSLLVTAQLVWTCWRGNDGYYIEANKYCNKPFSSKRLFSCFLSGARESVSRLELLSLTLLRRHLVCSSKNDCGWPCPYCKWNGYQKRKR